MTAKEPKGGSAATATATANRRRNNSKEGRISFGVDYDGQTTALGVDDGDDYDDDQDDQDQDVDDSNECIGVCRQPKTTDGEQPEASPLLDSFDAYIVVSVLTATASFAALFDEDINNNNGGRRRMPIVLYSTQLSGTVLIWFVRCVR